MCVVERIEDRLRALGRQFVNGAFRVCSAALGCAVEISVNPLDGCAEGACAIIAARKMMQNGYDSSGRDLIHGPAEVFSSKGGRSVKIAIVAQGHSANRTIAVGVVEVVDHG